MELFPDYDTKLRVAEAALQAARRYREDVENALFRNVEGISIERNIRGAFGALNMVRRLTAKNSGIALLAEVDASNLSYLAEVAGVPVEDFSSVSKVTKRRTLRDRIADALSGFAPSPF